MNLSVNVLFPDPAAPVIIIISELSNMCNIENKQNTQIHKKDKIINYKKNYKKMRK